ncbi:hypothetical protein MUP46_00595 [Patescibacteria group bacterium]|nr:hypothetical protein [Patescibacteria group bacterium]
MKDLVWVPVFVAIILAIRTLFASWVGFDVDINDVWQLVRLGTAFAISFAMLGVFVTLMVLKANASYHKISH